MYSDRNATQSASQRRGSDGMHRPSNAAWVLPPAANSLGGPVPAPYSSSRFLPRIRFPTQAIPIDSV